MSRRRLCAWGVGLIIWLAVLATGKAAIGADESGLKRTEIPLEPSSAAVEAAITQTRAMLAEEHFSPPPPAGKDTPHFVKTTDGRGILLGDFAGDGDTEALVELSAPDGDNAPGVAFACWHEGQWVVRNLWGISPTWRPAGWKNGDGDYLPITPAEQPFWIEHLEGDAAAWVVIAGDVWKYWQEHFVLRFDAKQKRLQLLDSAMGKPKFLSGGWLRLYFSSGHRSVFGEWRFLRWRAGKLVMRASWHEESPYNDVDPPFIDAARYDVTGKRQFVYRITDADANAKQITRDKCPFATVTFLLPRSLREQTAVDPDGREAAFLFEKLTGLPRELHPDWPNAEASADHKPPPRLEDTAGTRVKGVPRAVRLLTVPAHGGHG